MKKEKNDFNGQKLQNCPTCDYEIKEVVWKEEYDMVMPFCPYCDEPAYDKDECVFCHKKYIMTDKPKGTGDTIIQYKDFTITQVYGSWGVYIEKNGKLIAHASCTKKLTEDELIDLVKNKYDK